MSKVEPKVEPKYGTPEWDEYVALQRDRLERNFGEVWNTEEVQQDFTVHSFLAPFVFVTRKSDGAEGTLAFQHSPRFYYRFEKRG
jgi:hypothetical protein